MITYFQLYLYIYLPNLITTVDDYSTNNQTLPLIVPSCSTKIKRTYNNSQNNTIYY